MMRSPFPGNAKSYLTRLETRMDPAAMSEDITLRLDPRPIEFRVSIQASASYSQRSSTFYYSVTVDASGNICAAGFIGGTETFGFGEGITAAGADSGGNLVLVKYNPSGASQWAQTVTIDPD
jgi:hypothetical protein